MEATPSPRQLLPSGATTRARRGHQLIPGSTPYFKRALISWPAIAHATDHQLSRDPVTSQKNAKKTTSQLTPARDCLGWETSRDNSGSGGQSALPRWPVETDDLFLPMTATRAFAHDKEEARSWILSPDLLPHWCWLAGSPSPTKLTGCKVVSYWVRSGCSQQTIPSSFPLHRWPGSPPQRRSVS